MKKIIILSIFVSAVLVNVPFAAAQIARGQSMNGSTGLFSIPSGRIGWESSGSLALDLGYRAVINNNGGVAHIPAVTLSLFNFMEVSSAIDFQPDRYNNKNDDLLMGLKFKMPTKNTAIAVGGNMQLINFTSGNNNSYNAFQIYAAITYPGSFFNTTAETTIVFGKTFISNRQVNSDIDFGMGFDVVLFPDVFANVVHWIIDFANFSYSDEPWKSSAKRRGILNTGLRIDLSAIPALSKTKFNIDLIFNDLFDAGERSFTIGAVFGFSVK